MTNLAAGSETVVSAKAPVRVILVDEDESAESLLSQEIQKYQSAWTIRRYAGRSGWEEEGNREPFDVIVYDPRPDELASLKEFVQSHPQVPWFVWTALPLDEERYSEMLGAGVADVVAKSDSRRLVPSIRKELRQLGTDLAYSQEQAFRRQRTVRRAELDQIAALVAETPGQRQHKFLTFGCRELGMESVAVSEVTGPVSRVIDCISSYGTISPGTTYATDETFSKFAIDVGEVVAVADTEQDSDRDYSRLISAEVRSYVCFHVSTSRHRQVVICFTSRTPRATPFSPEDVAFVRSIAYRVDVEMRMAEKEREIALSRALFDVFMNYSPVVAYLKWPYGTFNYSNLPADEHLRRWSERLPGQTEQDVLSPEAWEAVRETDREVIETSRPVQATVDYDIPGLGHRYMQVLKFPVESHRGEPMIGGLLVDVTDRVRAEAELREQVERLMVLQKIDLIFEDLLDLPRSLCRALEEARRVVAFEGAAVIVNGGAGQGFEILASLGSWDPEEANQERFISLRGKERASAKEMRGIEDRIFLPLTTQGHQVGHLFISIARGQTLAETDRSFLESVASVLAMSIETDSLVRELHVANRELVNAYEATLEGWSRSLEARDTETEGHSRRVTEMGLQLAKHLGYPESELVHFRRGALLHDIGKIGIPDAVLQKPGELDAEERKVMERHPGLAYKMLSPIGFLAPALDIPYCHHERWDGKGYPRGLKGTEIPWAARIFAVVDVFDALTSDRPYRAAWSIDRAKEYLIMESGKQFDPEAVAGLVELMNVFQP